MKTKIAIVLMFLLAGMPFALAQNNETTEIKGGKEYTGLSRAIDRVKLVFSFQVERKTALIEKIEQRRAEHYDFLVAKGKTEQAAKFNEQTIGLVRNFDQWKANKQEIIAKTENTSDVKQSEKAPARNITKAESAATEEKRKANEVTQ